MQLNVMKFLVGDSHLTDTDLKVHTSREVTLSGVIHSVVKVF